MTFDFSSLKFSTKSLIAFLLGLGSLMQIPQVSAPVMAFGQHHPHVAVIIAMLTGIITLLHNPQVEKLLGMNPAAVADAINNAAQAGPAAYPVSASDLKESK